MVSTADKVKLLLQIIRLDGLGIEVVQIGPYALVPIFGILFAIFDVVEAADRLEIQRRISELRSDSKYKDLQTCICPPKEFLAMVVTGGRYHAFHDGMVNFIKVTRFVKIGFLWFSADRVDYDEIDRVLSQAGFENLT